VPVHHRTGDAQCSTTPTAGDCTLMAGLGDCSVDSDCTTGTNGRCAESNGGALRCSCTYDTCIHDTDCVTGQTCACHDSAYMGGGNACTPGNCRVDGDCGAGGYCSPSYNTMSCGGLAGYYCHTATDACLDDGDCSATSSYAVCTYVASAGHWQCKNEMLCP
jgi:hypothetical protein